MNSKFFKNLTFYKSKIAKFLKNKKLQFLTNIFNLFFPRVCLTCSKQIMQNENIICTKCRHDLALTKYTSQTGNLLEKSLYGKIPIDEATALFIFHKKSKIQQLIHQLKYRGHQEIGAFVGFWLGAEINKSSRFKNIDYIVPVPLHPKKLKKRGYNQLTTFGETLSSELNIKYLPNKLIKIGDSNTQTFKNKLARRKNVNEVFSLNDLNIFKNKHILLIDDVITTGATIEACVNELLKSEGIKISIAVMAYTE